MKNYLINNLEELKQFETAYGYIIDGNLNLQCPCTVIGYIEASGYIKANEYIEASGYIKANEYIEADGYIMADGFIKADGPIKAGNYIEASGHIEASGYIRADGYIMADGFIKADGPIKADGYIRADGYIKADGFIKADGPIKADGYIRADGYIKAGNYIEADGYIFSFLFDISAKKIKTKTVPFWRNYWAKMPPFKNWHDAIMDGDNCWEDLKALFTKGEAEQICAWEGWHWILRAHLEMFFGLKTEVEPPE